MNEAGEGLDQREQIPVRNLETGDVFKPFGEIKELPPMNPVLLGPNKFVEETQRIAEFPFAFKGARGIIDLNPDIYSDEGRNKSRSYHWSDKEENTTPLGKVNLVKKIEDDKITIEQAPLSLGLFFHVSSIEQFQELQKHAVELTLGDKKYYMSCVIPWEEWQSDEFFVRRGIPIPPRRREGQRFYNKEIIPEEKLEELQASKSPFFEPPTVLLPYDISKLNQIEAKIVERKIYPDKETYNPDFT